MKESHDQLPTKPKKIRGKKNDFNGEVICDVLREDKEDSHDNHEWDVDLFQDDFKFRDFLTIRHLVLFWNERLKRIDVYEMIVKKKKLSEKERGYDCYPQPQRKTVHCMVAITTEINRKREVATMSRVGFSSLNLAISSRLVVMLQILVMIAVGSNRAGVPKKKKKIPIRTKKLTMKMVNEVF